MCSKAAAPELCTAELPTACQGSAELELLGCQVLSPRAEAGCPNRQGGHLEHAAATGESTMSWLHLVPPVPSVQFQQLLAVHDATR